ncbi:histidine phosphatase family protein [Cellulophaga sp. HaHaR_3_176]|uniref:histidine phosphatase family protein n=1 Tax=Cellulophaga sp. HaHaR_3_176 TaxID=1942464 RepID=UPI001C20025B|nr:histidine phosphatase family protein [Cellulophaga sp. HaHaR_3_176]QWX85066.1 histidine phosphatase family protein [Cellulophaga sp. HaHaR_3_176]
MKTIKLLLLSFILISITSCKDDASTEIEKTEPEISTFYFIRHAEKDRSNPENLDPELNQEGLGRSIRWERVFSEIDLDEVYCTDYERTMMTGAPTAINQDIMVKYYEPESLNYEDFKFLNQGKNVLVIGHSNTTPDFVNKMIGEDKYEQMDDYDNSSLFIVRFIDDKPTSIRLKMD